ncbi:hypothetical protein KI688_005874 [Linnemannia hyalina]|uniref:Uncharacterized protein n=1 Tax=Linnemannia hyalina TaxID=64524 RepID=A0A9P7Y2M8_9FUNG|nr:hypothetical protein KI688_005874 [Linnemannia hyalina]
MAMLPRIPFKNYSKHSQQSPIPHNQWQPTNPSRTLRSNAANYCAVVEYVRCLLYARWPSVNSCSIMIPEHFVLAGRHSMLLMNENVRYLDISDCSMDTFVKQSGGTREFLPYLGGVRGRIHRQCLDTNEALPNRRNKESYRNFALCLQHSVRVYLIDDNSITVLSGIMGAIPFMELNLIKSSL